MDYQLPEIVAPSTDKIISFKLRNGLDIDLDWELRVKEGDEILGTTSGILTTELTPDWLEVSFTQPENNLLSLELYSNTTNEVVDTKQIRVDLAKPIIQISNLSFDHYPLVANEINSFHYKIKNSSAYTLNDFETEYSSEYIEFPGLAKQRISLEPGQECTVYSDIFQLTSDVDYVPLNLSFTLSNDYWQEETLDFPYYLSVADESFYETFEEEATWFEESAWQRNDFYSYAGNYSLTCSPQDYGQYDLDLPLLTYTDNLTLSFMYKYKMPMYGEDGFSVYVVTDDSQERLIFLGSGGALENQDKDPEDLISGDWAEISLNLSDLLLNEPEIGSEFLLRFSFTYIHDLNVNNDYANNDDLGVFLDNMQICYDGQIVSNEDDVESVDNHISLYPNPLSNSLLNIKHNSKLGEEYEVSIYNLKGQKVDSFKSTIKSMDKESIQLPIFQKNRSKMASGIYFVNYKSVDTSVTKKILFLK
jgi:hypothetical protein